MSHSDYTRRELGVQSQLAVQAIETAVWSRSVELFRRAEGLYAESELTPERSQELLIGLLEQRKVLAQLVVQVQEGERANRRIVQQIEKETAETATEAARRANGGNRFFRSRVDSRPVS